ALCYMAEFKIPWIWRWDLEFHFDDLLIPCISRTFHYKWWDGFPITDTHKLICQTVIEYENAYKATQKSVSISPSDNIFQFLLDDIQKKYPNLSSIDQQIKAMEIIKNQFLAHHQKQDIETKILDDSSSQENQYAVLAGESQDPN